MVSDGESLLMNAALEMHRVQWCALRRAARELDVAKGGYWRAYRDGRIAFFCGPESPAPGGVCSSWLMAGLPLFAA